MLGDNNMMLNSNGQNMNSAVGRNSAEQAALDAFSQGTPSSTVQNEQASISSVGSSQSSGGTSIGAVTAKSLLFQQRSPRILNMYFSLVFATFIAFIAVITINFSIFMTRKANVTLQI